MLRRRLSDNAPIEIALTDPWMPYADPRDHLLLPYGEAIVVRRSRGEPRPGTVVLAAVDGALALRRVASARDGEVRLDDGRRSGPAPGPPGTILGQVVAVRSRRLGLTVPLKPTLLRVAGPLLRAFKADRG